MSVSSLVNRWPTLVLAAACAGLGAANWVNVRLLPSVAVAALLGALAVAAPDGGSRAVLVAASLAVVGLAWGSVRADELGRSLLATRVGERGSARVVVVDAAHSTSFSVRMPVDVLRFGAVPLRERALLELRGRSPPRGAVLELVRARLRAPRGPETGFDERAWLERRGIHVVLQASEMRVVGRRGGIGGAADRLRAHLERTLDRGSSGERLALLRGFVLGDDDRIGTDLRYAFRSSGLAHLTAVSGQNVVIVAGAIGGVAWLAGLGRGAAHLLAIAAILGYALAVGWEPSVVRAAVAGCVTSVAWLASRPNDRWHALALGALVLLAWQPASLLEPGFQLSFAAVAAILVVVPRVQPFVEGYPLPGAIGMGAAVAAACSVATAPISLAQFGMVSLWGVPANIAAEPAMPVLLCLSLAAGAVSPIAPSAAAALTWLAGLCAAWIAGCARLFGGLPHARVGPIAAAVGAGVALAAAGIVWRARYRRSFAAAAVVTAVVVGSFGWWMLNPRPSWQPPAGLRVTFLDVGQGDGILVETREGALLVDQGPPEARVARQLASLGVRSLSAVVLTHPQRDHIGGAADVLRHLRVGVVLHPDLPVESADQRAALAEAQRRGIRVEIVRKGDTFRLGALTVRVLWPDGPGPPGDDPNFHAVVLLASYGSVDVLLTADAESDVTGRLRIGAVEVLKVAHHGSDDPGLARQLRLLRPRIAIVSVGAGNDYGHPRPETLAALAAVPRLLLLRTDTNGRVVVETDGSAVTATSERG